VNAVRILSAITSIKTAVIKKHQVIIIGAGIVGLAIARSHATRGHKVTIFEREDRTNGATIRNFGLYWPMGQPLGPRFNRAVVSGKIWRELANEAGVEMNNTGSLTLARSELEFRVMREFVTYFGNGLEAIKAEEACRISSAARPNGLVGALYSPLECTVNPRQAAPAIVSWLKKSAGVTFHFGMVVTKVESGAVTLADGTRHEADQVYVCSGGDLRTLFPQELSAAGVTVCKLQMLRTATQPDGWKLGPALCAGLTLGHYDAFNACASLPELKKHFESTRVEETKWGVHVLVSQNGDGGLTLGDTHEYGATHDPFQRTSHDEIVLSYLNEFAKIPEMQITERWIGLYPKIPGKSELVLKPMPRVTLVNALSGAGMTLSFGLAEELVGEVAS